MRTILGVAVGASVTPALIHDLPRMAMTLAMVPLYLAFAPGGQAEMAILAILAGADVAFIVAHHVMRLVIVILVSPVVERLWLRRFQR